MRLDRSTLAVAIVIALLVPAFPSAAASPPSAALGLEDGAILTPRASVEVTYTGWSSDARNLTGHLLLDGAWAGSFSARLPEATKNNTTNGTIAGPVNGTANGTANGSAAPSSIVVQARLAAGGFAGGAYTLVARVSTEVDAPVDSPGVAVVLDTPPSLSASASYDLDTRQLRVQVDVADDGGEVDVVVKSGNATSSARMVGHAELVLDAPRPPGTYVASVSARDAQGQTAAMNVTYEVTDRETEATSLLAAYERGGMLRIEAVLADADGGLRSVEVTSRGGRTAAELRNGTWHATLRITPALGEQNGTILARDQYGGFTSLPFSYTIDGPVETVWTQNISTTAGAHVDAFAVRVPPLLGGVIEICVDGCETPPRGVVPCSPCPGDPRPILEGFRVCRPSGHPFTGPGANVLGALVWNVTHLLDNATKGAFCEAYREPLTAPSGVGIAFMDRSNATAPPRLLCSSTGDDVACTYNTTSHALLDVLWTQARAHQVEVRIRGILV